MALKLYRYFDKVEYLESFYRRGEVMFNTLSYFLAIEDDGRRDETENLNIYSPAGGLICTNVRTKEQTVLPAALISKIPRADRIYIYCTSTEYSSKKYRDFKAIGCAEIADAEEFRKRIERAIRQPHHNMKNKSVLAGKVEYYDPQLPPGARYAFTDMIVMAKPKKYADEAEYRFAFSKDKDAFSAPIDYTISTMLPSPVHAGKGKLLYLGDLSDIIELRYR